MKSIIVTSLLTLQIAGLFGGNANTNSNLNVNKYLNRNTNNCKIELDKDALTKGSDFTDKNSKTGKSNCNTTKTYVIVNGKKTTCPTSNKKVAVTKPTTKPKTQTKTETPKTEAPKSQAPKTDAPKNTSNKYDSSFASQVLKLVNAERVKGGLQELTMSPALTAPANKRAQEIKTQFSHTRPNGTQWSTVLDEYGVSVRTAGENLAYGYNTPEAVVEGWMNSPGHRANIMNGNFNQIGIGVYTDSNGTVYCTQLFSN